MPRHLPPWHRPRSTRRLATLAALASLTLALAAAWAPSASASTDAEIQDANCTANTLPANDDGSTGQVDLGFTADFYGQNFTTAFVNNNGNVTFQNPLSTYTPFTIDADTPPIIAPFLADVDTRGVGSLQTTYGQTTYAGHRAFCVDWNQVGYFSGHTDKLNSFQLVLVSRNDLGAGDFDVLFDYDSIQWETGDASGGSGGLGGTSAGAGFSAGDGDVAHFVQLDGSLVNGALLDSNAATGLIHNSRGTLTLGRYQFGIRNGNAPGSATIGGTVSGPGGTPLGAATVQVCSTAATPFCVIGLTSSLGVYSVVGLPPATYVVTANPPAGSDLGPAVSAPTTVDTGDSTTVDLTLTGPTPPPSGTSISTGNAPTADGIPVIFWGSVASLDTRACAGGSASYSVTQGTQVIRTGSMVESPPGSGHYHADVAAFYPQHGYVHITITTTCPAGGTDVTGFDVYIDPSGTVVTPDGQPVQGATVTLLRSDTPDGVFEPVPDGSPVMSPSNRANPDTTLADGSFHWDVIAGFYEVTASKAGCTTPAGDATAVTGVLQIPPPVLNLRLVLSCGTTPPGNATMQLMPTASLRGAYTLVTLGGFTPNSRIRLSVGGKAVSTIKATATGMGYTALRIPAHTTLGPVPVTAVSGTTTASATLTVTTQCVPAPPSGAPRSVRAAYTVAVLTGNACPV